MNRAAWEAWKDRNAWWWDIFTAPVQLLAVVVLKAWKWVYRLRRL